MSKRLIVCGDLDGVSGYSMHLERIVHDFLSFGYDVRVRPTKYSEEFGSSLSSFVKERIVFSVQPEPWELLLHYPSIIPTNGKNVAYFTMAETTRPSAEQVEHINRAKVAIVPCQWNAKCFKESGVNIPIHVVPLGFDPLAFMPGPLTTTGPCVFLTAGRLLHGKSRKGTNAVIDCFLKAFPKGTEDVFLIVKGFPDCEIKPVSDPRIKVIKKYLDTGEMANLIHQCHCFVSAARGEGFGLLQLEACASGRPVIASIFGGLADFLNPSICYPVPFTVVDADERYRDRGQWALPSQDHIVGSMRHAYEHREEARNKGELAATSVKHLTWTNSNRTLEAALKSWGAIDYPKAPKLVFSSVWGKPEKPQEIIIRRSNAFGDVLAATCVAEKLISMGHDVVFQTIRACQPILKYSTRIKKIEDTNARECHVNLDGAYENHPDRRTKTFSEIYVESANNQLQKHGVQIDTHLQSTPSLTVSHWDGFTDQRYKHPWVMICPKSANWPNRTVPDKIWQAASAQISGTVFWLGMEPAPDRIVDIGARSIDQVIKFLSKADLFVTVDTGPMHIAAALGISMVVIEQSSSPRLHLSDQRDFMVISPPLDCLNCQTSPCPISEVPPCQDVIPESISAAVNQKLIMFEESVSAVIPVYNPSAARLNRCLEAVLPQVDQVVVSVDGDGKTPDGILVDPKITFVRNWTGQQLGYGRNANHGARHTFGKWILFLNDDCYLDRDYVDHCLYDALEDTGLLAGLLRYPSGKIQHGGTRRGGIGWGHIDHNLDTPSITESCEMENVTHAAALIRRTAFYKAGAYAEHLPVGYWDDNWLNLAIRKCGYKIIYCPHATGIHDEHQTTRSIGREQFKNVVNNNRNLFLKEWGPYFLHNKDESKIGNFDYL